MRDEPLKRMMGGLIAVLGLTAALLAPARSAPGPRITMSAGFGFSAGPDGNLYRIDLATGAATLDAPTAGLAGQIEALAWNNSTSHLIGVDVVGDRLVNFPGDTAETLAFLTTDGITPLPVRQPGLTFSDDGTTLFLSNLDEDGTFNLYAIAVTFDLSDPNDPLINTDGIAFLLTPLSEPVVGLGNRLGVLYGLGGADLADGVPPPNNAVIIDPKFGDTPLGKGLGLPFDVFNGGLDVDPGTLDVWGIDDGSGFTIPTAKPAPRGILFGSHLFQIDPETGQAIPGTLVTVNSGGDKPVPLNGFASLAIPPPAPQTECSGQIQVSVNSINFGTVGAKQTKTRSFTIRNVSKSEDLTVSIQQPDGPFSVKNSELDFTLAPGERRTVVVKYSPGNKSKGKDSADLQIDSSDCKNPSVTVHLKGSFKGHLHIGPFPVIDPQPAPPPDHVPTFPGLGSGKGGGKKKR